MQSFHFDNVELVLAEPSQQVRHGLKAALRAQGFHRITELTRFNQLRQVIESTAPDLVISDIELPGGDACGLFHAIRHHQMGKDPFVPVIAVSWSASEGQVCRVIDSGADDLLIKPISTNNLIVRIKHLIQARKPFVVTTEYIGPDRRAGHRPGTEKIPTLEVPNKLQAKATGKADVNSDVFQEAIDKAAAVINERKMERHAHQLVYLANHVAPAFKAGAPDSAVFKHVERTIYVAEDLARRMKKTRFSHISELCESLIKVTNAILAMGDSPATKDLDLMVQLSLAIQASYSADERVVAAAHHITDSVDKAVLA